MHRNATPANNDMSELALIISRQMEIAAPLATTTKGDNRINAVLNALRFCLGFIVLFRLFVKVRVNCSACC